MTVKDLCKLVYMYVWVLGIAIISLLFVSETAVAATTEFSVSCNV